MKDFAIKLYCHNWKWHRWLLFMIVMIYFYFLFISLAMDVLLSTASIMNLCLISLDRYWSITKAVEYLKTRTPTRALVMIAAVWMMSALICIPPLLGWGVKRSEDSLPQCEVSCSNTFFLQYSKKKPKESSFNDGVVSLNSRQIEKIFHYLICLLIKNQLSMSTNLIWSAFIFCGLQPHIKRRWLWFEFQRFWWLLLHGWN